MRPIYNIIIILFVILYSGIFPGIGRRAGMGGSSGKKQ